MNVFLQLHVHCAAYLHCHGGKRKPHSIELDVCYNKVGGVRSCHSRTPAMQIIHLNPYTVCSTSKHQVGA